MKLQEIIGSAAGILYPLCFFVCYIPQLKRTFCYKDVEGLSYKMFLFSLLGYISCALYMLKVGFNMGMAVNSVAGAICCIVLMKAIKKYRK